METIFQDIRYGLRMLRKSLGFTSVAVLTLALGIGANTAIFSLVSGILLQQLPYPKPSELVSVTGSYPRGGLVAMREQLHTMKVGAYAEGHDFNLTSMGEPVRLTGTLVSAELLSILGTRPELGRTFYPGEDAAGQDNYMILSHAVWQQRFGSDKTIIGRSVQVEGVSRQVIGVMPPDFRFPSGDHLGHLFALGPRTEIFKPLGLNLKDVSNLGEFNYTVIARVKAGVSQGQALAN